jgi:uncharacterized protein YukE
MDISGARFGGRGICRQRVGGEPWAIQTKPTTGVSRTGDLFDILASLKRPCGEAKMSKAHVDPVELRRFAADLNRFNVELSALVGSIHGKLRGLEQTWRDAEQRKFTEAFDQTAKALSVFMESSVYHVQFLNKKANLIEEYLKQR